MAFETLPVRSDLPSYNFQITLDGVIYGLSFNWSRRAGLWTMDIADEIGTPMLMGIRLFQGFPLISRFFKPGLPPREFFCIDTANQGKDPGEDDLGARVLLIYGDDS